MWVAINVSVVVRLLYHLYQGPIGVLTIVPMGLLYGYLYSRTRQLWPLVVAHVLLVIIRWRRQKDAAINRGLPPFTPPGARALRAPLAAARDR